MGGIQLAGISLTIWGAAWPEPYVACIALLAIAPVAALVLAGFSPDGLSLGDDERPGRASIAQLFLGPALVLGLRGLSDMRLLDWGVALGLAGAIGVVLSAAALWADEELRQIWVGGFLALVGFGYGWGLLSEANVLLDANAPHLYRAEVVRKWEAGGRSPQQNLSVTGTGVPGLPEEVEVGWDFYEAIRLGDEVCVAIYPGALGWRWFDIGFCPQ